MAYGLDNDMAVYCRNDGDDEPGGKFCLCLSDHEAWRWLWLSHDRIVSYALVASLQKCGLFGLDHKSELSENEASEP